MNKSLIKDILLIGIFGGIFLLLLTPFIVANGMFFPFITGKAYFFRIITEIIFGLYLILAIIAPEYRIKKSPILYAFSVFLVAIGIANYLGVDRIASFWSNFERMEGYVTLVHLFALFIAMSSVMKEKINWKIFFHFSLVASIVMSFYAFNEISEKGFNERVDLTLGNSTYLGIYMLFNAFISLYFLLKQKFAISNFLIYFYSFAFLMQTIVLFQTGTRGSMIGILGGLFLTAILIPIFNAEKNNKKEIIKISAVILGIVIAFISAVFIFKNSEFVQNTVSLKRITTISINEGTAKARIINWKIAIEGFKERPVLGWGQSNFSYVFDKYYLPEHYGNETWFDRVHNIFFDWLIAGGIVGLISYLSLWFATIYLLFKAKNFEGKEKAVLIGMLAGYFFHNFFVFDQIVSYIYFIFILAFIHSVEAEEIKLMKNNLRENTIQLFSILFLILIPITVYYTNYPSYSANKDLRYASIIFTNTQDGKIAFQYDNGLYGNMSLFQNALSKNTFANREVAERIISTVSDLIRIEGIDPKMLNDYFDFASAEMEKIISEAPNSARYQYMYGIYLLQTNKIESAEKYLLKAIQLSPRKQAMRIATIELYKIMGKKDSALDLAKSTYELDKSKDVLFNLYASVLSNYDNEKLKEFLQEEIKENGMERIEKMMFSRIEKNPEKYENYITLAVLYFQADEIEKSKNTLQEAKIKFPAISKQIDKIIADIDAGKNPTNNAF